MTEALKCGHLYKALIFFEKLKEILSPAREKKKNAERFLDEYGNSILRFAYSYLHNISDSEDILQDVLIKYLESTPQFENEAHEKAWLFTVTANLCKNKLKYDSIRETDLLEDTLAKEEKEDLSFVWEAVKALPQNKREIVHLYYYEGYSLKEISQILNKNESTVRSSLKRARDELKIQLREVYDFE